MPRPPASKVDISKVGTDPPKGKSAPPRTAERARMMKDYHAILRRVVAIMGRKKTTNHDLERYMRRFGLTDCEVGPLSMYKERKKNPNAPKYGIYNTMYVAPGQHWFCCYKGHKYDPLGNDSSDTQEQPDNDDDCGQRCIAYLLLCKKKGGPLRM